MPEASERPLQISLAEVSGKGAHISLGVAQRGIIRCGNIYRFHSVETVLVCEPVSEFESTCHTTQAWARELRRLGGVLETRLRYVWQDNELKQERFYRGKYGAVKNKLHSKK